MDTNQNINRKKLLISVLIKYISTFIIVGSIIFIPAWTLNYYNAWILMAIFFIPMFLVMIYLLKNNPELLAKRIQTREKEKEQKTVQKTGAIIMLIEFILPGLDYRFQWSAVPLWLVAVSAIVFLTGYFLFFIVMKQNTYASRVIEIQEKQKIIDTGLYGIVRHPMYSSILLIYSSAPLVLGSYFALIPFLALPFILAYRIKNEEDILMNGLEGYTDYIKRVKYRMVPFIW